MSGAGLLGDGEGITGTRRTTPAEEMREMPPLWRLLAALPTREGGGPAKRLPDCGRRAPAGVTAMEEGVCGTATESAGWLRSLMSGCDAAMERPDDGRRSEAVADQGLVVLRS